MTESSESNAAEPAFLANGGEMGALMRAHDWSNSSLGPPSGWPQSLRTVVRLMLNTGHPMYIWWGAEGACLYNDAYRQSIGPERHPGSLGRPAREVWDEIWDIIGPQIEHVMTGRGATWHENALVPITRNGKREDVYWTYSYGPIDDDSAPHGVGGVLVVCTETTQTVLAEQRRTEQLNRQRHMFEQAPSFVCMLQGPDHIYEFVNNAHKRLFNSGNWLNKPVREVIPGIVEQGYLEKLDRVYRTGERFIAKAAPLSYRRTPSGPMENRLLDFIYEPIVDEDGQVSGIFCEGFDVTETREAEQALRASEEQLRLATEAAELGLWDVDTVTNSLYWPARVKAMFGISPHVPVSMDDFYNGLHPEDRERVSAAFAAALDPAIRAVYDVEYRTIGKEDAVVRWVAAKGRAIFDDHGACLRVVGTAIDITSRKRVEAQLRDLNDTLEQRVAARTAELHRSELQFEQLVAGVTDYAIYMLDKEGHVVTWNAGAERIKGYTRNEIVGQHFSRFYTDEDRATQLPNRALATAFSFGKYEAEAWRVRKNGERFWASIIINAIYDAEGKLLGYAKVTRDLSERRAMEEQLRQSQKLEAIGQLTGGVAHDFNNLLTVILGNLETIWRQTSRENGKLHRAIDQATRGAQRAASLTQQLLAFARRQPLSPKPTDVNHLVSNMSDLIRRTIGEHIAVECVLAGGLWRVEIDPHQLESALLNLAVNSRDAMPAGGKLTIETANAHLDNDYAVHYPEIAAGQYVLISVTDNGTGMSKDILERAFDPFFTTKPIGQGTGLGLSQVYGFVKQSGGHVKLYSETGDGTTVHIYLPKLAAHVAEEKRPRTVPVPRGNRHEVILVIEDDEAVRLYSTEALSELGFTVLEAADAQAALQVLQAHPEIQLLFTDVGLPGINGAQLAAQARAQRPDLKVLFTTGYARNAIVHQGRLDAGVNLITKPFSRAQLASRIREVLDAPPPKATTRQVLLIEDEVLVRRLYVEQFQDLGFQVIEAGSAAEGLAAVRNYPQLDLVVIDRGLPDRDGLEVVIELRAQLRLLPIIVVSGYGAANDDQSLKQDQLIRFLSKPYTADHLAKTIEALGLSEGPCMI